MQHKLKQLSDITKKYAQTDEHGSKQHYQEIQEVINTLTKEEKDILKWLADYVIVDCL